MSSDEEQAQDKKKKQQRRISGEDDDFQLLSLDIQSLFGHLHLKLQYSFKQCQKDNAKRHINELSGVGQSHTISI